MISKEINGKEYLFVEVPEDAYDFEVYNTYQKEIRYLYKGSVNAMTGTEKIVVISLRKFCKTLDKIQFSTASDLTEEQWKGIVECVDKHFGYYRYYNNDVVDGDKCTIRSSKESGLSLIASLNLKPETTLIIQKL